MDYSKEQLKAAYALNLCTVSISQIIDYNDVNIMEQEYEAILNNLNLEQIPKDEALLNILKQILDTITFFRIQENEKALIEKKYQQKMKNALWSAVPNLGLLIAGGNSVTMAASLASQVGIGYMNYRKVKAEIHLETDEKRWELERTAIEQFHGLRRELFDTAWRLSANYNFPDELRLTERQIKQYNAILMDNDLLRKYERLTAIQDAFVAYPPFWYYYGNTANSIAQSDLPLSNATREYYKTTAKNHFFQYRNSNQYSLLREDPVSASCALELLELLDFNNDANLIRELLEEAIKYSGRANDILQLASISYLKLNDYNRAANLLRQLVNEQYNTILNAQLLSSIYVKHYINTQSTDTLNRYEILCAQVGAYYLYPMPQNRSISIESIETEFIAFQKQILQEKYILAMKAFIEKYLVKFGKLIPVADTSKTYTDAYFLASDYAIKRKHEFAKIFSNNRKVEDYKYYLQEADIPDAIIELLNEMFDTSCTLDLMTRTVQTKLAAHIEKSIISHKEKLNAINKRIREGTVDYIDMEKMLDIKFTDFTTEFFQNLFEEINRYIHSRKEMQDFIIAEENLTEFCSIARIPDPIILFGKEGNNLVDLQEPESKRFSIELLGDKNITIDKEIFNEQKMLDLIKSAIPQIVSSWDVIDFFTNEDPKKERYFRNNKKLKIASLPSYLMTGTLAILDDKTKKDYDLLFTVYGIVPIKHGVVKNPISYQTVTWSTGKNKSLMIDGKFENPAVDSNKIFELAQSLKEYEKSVPSTSSALSSAFKLADLKNSFFK